MESAGSAEPTPIFTPAMRLLISIDQKLHTSASKDTMLAISIIKALNWKLPNSPSTRMANIQGLSLSGRIYSIMSERFTAWRDLTTEQEMDTKTLVSNTT